MDWKNIPHLRLGGHNKDVNPRDRKFKTRFPWEREVVENICQDLITLGERTLIWIPFNVSQGSLESFSVSPLNSQYNPRMIFFSPLFCSTKCVVDKFAIIVDAAVDVLHEIHRVEDGDTHTE